LEQSENLIMAGEWLPCFPTYLYRTVFDLGEFSVKQLLKTYMFGVADTLVYNVFILLLVSHAPLGVCSVKRRHQSPEWTILSHV